MNVWGKVMVLLGVGHPLEGRGMAAGKPCATALLQELFFYRVTHPQWHLLTLRVKVGDFSNNNTHMVPYGWARVSLVLDTNIALSAYIM